MHIHEGRTHTHTHEQIHIDVLKLWQFIRYFCDDVEEKDGYEAIKKKWIKEKDK